jgi:hypothetical protein
MCPSLFARSPDWAVQFDMDAEMARQTRRRVFDMLVKENTHGRRLPLPLPGVGPPGSGRQRLPVQAGRLSAHFRPRVPRNRR